MEEQVGMCLILGRKPAVGSQVIQVDLEPVPVGRNSP